MCSTLVVTSFPRKNLKKNYQKKLHSAEKPKDVIPKTWKTSFLEVETQDKPKDTL